MTEMLKTGKYSALTIANEFIVRAQKEQQTLSRNKLHNLVYLAHAHHLVLHERPLIYEAIEAWQYQPIIHELYRILKPMPQTEIDARLEAARPKQIDSRDFEITHIISEIWSNYETYAYTDLLPALQEPTQKRKSGFSNFQKSPVVADWLIRAHFSEVF